MAETNGNGRLRIDPMVAFQVIAWIVAALITYGVMNARVSVMESRQTEIDRRQRESDSHLQRIEDKLDQLIQRRLP